MILGAHRSGSGGIWKAAESGREIGCDAIQVFTRAPQRWFGKPIADEEAEKFRQVVRDYKMPVVAHDIYLTNLAAANDDIRKKSIASFKDEIARCDQLGIPYLVTHCGAHDGDVDKGIHKVADALKECIDSVGSDSVMVLLEGTAGQGNALGSTFEQLAAMLDATSRPEKTGVCLDTCHLFASGYDLRTKDAYEKTFSEFDRIVGLSKLKSMHANDAKKDLGSHVDRHEHIGEGKLGDDAFRLLVNDTRLANIPILLETPDLDRHGEELARLRSLIND